MKSTSIHKYDSDAWRPAPGEADKSVMRALFYETALVLGIAAALAIGAYSLRPQALPLIPPTNASVQQPVADQQLFKPMPIEQAIELFNRGAALFADARSETLYAEGHIQGAVHLDPYAFDQWSETIVQQNPPDRIIITYCHGAQCPLARELAEKLTWLGFEKVYYLVDGWGQWQNHHLPVTKDG